MLNLIGKLFKKNDDSQLPKKHKVDTYTNENLDEIFAEHFTQNGGFFNYEENSAEGMAVLQKLLQKLNPECVYCIKPSLQSILEQFQLNYSKQEVDRCDVALIDCECLVALDGSIMVSSDNIQNHKIQNLPKHVIIWSFTNQLVSNKSRGLEAIRRAKTHHIPNNITSLNAKNSQDFLKHEFIKELYLLLIEDVR